MFLIFIKLPTKHTTMHTKLLTTFLLLLFCLLAASTIGAQAQTVRGLYVPDNSSGGTRPAQNEKRVALVIGNQSYQGGWGPLSNPVNDANTLETALKQCGFEVTKLTNTNRQQMLTGITNFASRISGSETVALFAYAGHGIEADGKNYLIPTDDASRCRDEVTANAVDLDFIYKKMNNAGAAMKIMIVDACRNNPLPFTCPSAIRSAEAQGFVQYTPKGTYVAFSTAPGQTASDGTRGSNSPYIKALANALTQDGLKIEDVFKQVRRQLDQIGQQTWDNNGYTGDFYFKPAKNNPPAPNNTVVNNNNNNNTKPTPPAPKPEVRKDLPNLPELVFVRGGTFTMGDVMGDNEETDETTHSVTLSDFYIGKYEVTLAQFKLFVEATGYQTDAEKEGYSYKWTTEWVKAEGKNWRHNTAGDIQTDDRHPVINVSWNDAVAYCAWASQISGKEYRLPTEAQWEYAAREGGKKLRFGNGKNTLDPREANYDGRAAYKKDYSVAGDYRAKTLPVGSFSGNSLGLYDMTGNVWEWCSDWYAADYYAKSPTRDPENTTLAQYRVLRGGSWFSNARDCRVAYRGINAPAYRGYFIGFRLSVR